MSTDDSTPASQRSHVTGKVEVIDGVTYYRPSFTPRVKHPISELALTLKTETAYRVFQATYDPVQQVFYHLYTTLPILCRDDQKVLKEVQGAAEEAFQTLELELAREHERVKVLEKNEGTMPVAKYSNDAPIVADTMTPIMTRYLSFLNRLDLMMRIVDALWHGTVIEPGEHTQKMLEWRNKVMRFNRVLNTLHMRAIGESDRQRFQAAKAAKKAAETPKAPAGKKVVSGRAKQKQQKRPGKVVVSVPQPADAVLVEQAAPAVADTVAASTVSTESLEAVAA